jgi:hypothetical protein
MALGLLCSCQDHPCENRNSCENRNCGDHGACVEVGDVGICECEDGWEFDNNERCNAYKLDNFPGRYTVDETCIDELTTQSETLNYEINMSILSQINSEIILVGLNKQSCLGQPLPIEAVVSNTSFSFKTGDYCASNDARFVIPNGSGSLEADGSYSLSYKLQYYEFGTILESKVCTATLSPQ